MTDIWSRAWCETQKIPNFAVKGITPSNEVRDAPNYLRPLSSEPTDHDSTCELSRSPSPDVSGILCYKLRKKRERRKDQSPPKSPPRRPVTPKLRSGEKIPNFKSPQSQASPESLLNSTLAPPLSPGRVRVHRNLSRTPSTVSSGYQYRVSPAPSPRPSTSTNPLQPYQDAIQPPSRNSAYSPPSTPASTERSYLDQLETENQQLKTLLQNQVNMVTPSHERGGAQYNRHVQKTGFPKNREISEKNVKSDLSVSGDDGQVIKTDTGGKELNNSSGDSAKNARKQKDQSRNIKSGFTNPDNLSVPDLVKIMPAQLSPNTSAKSAKPQQVPRQRRPVSWEGDILPLQPPSHHNSLSPVRMNTAANTGKPQQAPRINDTTPSNNNSRRKTSAFVFIGTNGEVLAESKGDAEGSDMVVKRVNEANSPKKETETKAWEKLKQISDMLEQSPDCHAGTEDTKYPCRTQNIQNGSRVAQYQ